MIIDPLASIAVDGVPVTGRIIIQIGSIMQVGGAVLQLGLDSSTLTTINGPLDAESVAEPYVPPFAITAPIAHAFVEPPKRKSRVFPVVAAFLVLLVGGTVFALTGRKHNATSNGVMNPTAPFNGQEVADNSVVCVNCNGSGRVLCPLCRGTGRKPIQRIHSLDEEIRPLSMTRSGSAPHGSNFPGGCEQCGGTGYLTCPVCGGSGKVSKNSQQSSSSQESRLARVSAIDKQLHDNFVQEKADDEQIAYRRLVDQNNYIPEEKDPDLQRFMRELAALKVQDRDLTQERLDLLMSNL